MLGRRQVLSSLSLSLVLSVAGALVACGPGSGDVQHAHEKPGAMPAGNEWNGVYFSQEFGYLHLVSDNRSANGAWRTTAGDAWGEMTGTIEGDLMHYEWTERKIGAIGADATKKGHGWFRYTVPKEGEAAVIAGEWGLGESDAGAPWKAVKQLHMDPKPESVRPDEIEGNTNVGGWDEDSKGGGDKSGDGNKTDVDQP
jgi:hypothetical protein